MDENLLGAVALLVPNEVTASVSSSTLRRPPAALLDSTSGEAMRVEGQRTVVTRRRRRRHHRDIDETQAEVIPPYGFAVEWLGSSSQPLRSIDLQFNSKPISEIDFSPDGSFLVSRGADHCVGLWNIHEIIGGGNVNPPLIQIDTEHGDGICVTCVAVSPNNRSIFSGGIKAKTILIHDGET